MSEIPTLAGVHHLKLPVTDLARSFDWYHSRFGYERVMDFVEHGELRGLVMQHPAGGPDLALRRDPERAGAAAGFDYFSIGVPDEAALRALADRLTALGDTHAGVHFASIGWILPELHDPDGHEVRFYSMTSHTQPSADRPVVMHDPRETSPEREAQFSR